LAAYIDEVAVADKVVVFATQWLFKQLRQLFLQLK